MEGEQGERSIEIRAWKMQRNRFHFFFFSLSLFFFFWRALKDAVSLLVEMVFIKKQNKKEKKTHTIPSSGINSEDIRHLGVLVISSGNCIINRHICKT